MCILLTQTICMVCNMQKLNLFNTKIGDAGVIMFSEAIAGGALALLNDLYLDNNPISDDAKHAMRTAMSNRSGEVHF